VKLDDIVAAVSAEVGQEQTGDLAVDGVDLVEAREGGLAR